MSRIRLLPDHVANQIAAGEVVERPASVVKELIENSLDAGATRIDVEVEAGGRSLIRVRDDGCGMVRDDALMCLERHATSKIREAGDLDTVRTMGFRGEAIPSMASISRFRLTTRDPESPAGTEILVDGGKLVDVRDCGGPVGTQVELRQLFFNLPARRKFLKSDETERAHIQSAVMHAGLAHPEVRFRFRYQGKLVFEWIPHSGETGETALRRRAQEILGRDLDLFWLDKRFQDPAESGAGLHLHGLLGMPPLSRATRQDQHWFVNQRPVDHRGLSTTLKEAFGAALASGRHPVGCLYIEVCPSEIDVNIHPAKREVKFRRDYWVRQQVLNAVSAALRDRRESLQMGKSQGGGAATRAPVESLAPSGIAEASKPITPVSRPFPSHLKTGGEKEPLLPAQPLKSTAGRVPAPVEMGVQPDHPVVVQPGQSSPPSSDSLRAKQPARSDEELDLQGASSSGKDLMGLPLRPIGVLGDQYYLLESDRGLVLMEARAAWERVTYERLVAQGGSRVEIQRLLLPETIEVSPKDAAFLLERLPALQDMGIHLSEFGERTFLLDAVPSFISPTGAREFLLDLLDGIRRQAGTAKVVASIKMEELAKEVSQLSARSHRPRSEAEWGSLLRDLKRCAMPYTCPAGRPTLIEISRRELDRKFQKG